MRKADFIHIYADTSVFGGVYDEEFDSASIAFFDQVRDGKRSLVTSDIVRREMTAAPEPVQLLFDEMLAYAEVAPVTAEALELEALELRQAYLHAGILTPKWLDDALHVALATVSGCDVIVSWNFKHIVHYQKIPLYNAVNALEGYGNILIHSPQEVIAYEDEEDL